MLKIYGYAGSIDVRKVLFDQTRDRCGKVHLEICWSKLQSIAEGARIASRALF